MSPFHFWSFRQPALLLLLLLAAALGTAPLHGEILYRQKDQSAEAFARAARGWRALDKELAAILARIIVSYPEEILAVETAGPGQPVTAHLRQGKRVPFEDMVKKGFEGRLASADIREMLSDFYPPDLGMKVWPVNLDPGRYRCVEFLKSVYGASSKEVNASLVQVRFCGKSVAFNSRNGAAAALASVGQELDTLVRRDPGLKPYVTSLGGTFAWRNVDGTGQLSAHSFAIAIDLNPDLGGYWRWEKRDLGSMGRRVKYPPAIVDAFERHGFIWGGKWYHYDLMHFEFRPEFQGKNPYTGRR